MSILKGMFQGRGEGIQFAFIPRSKYSSSEVIMKTRKFASITVLCAVLFLAGVSSAYAGDELILRGVLQEIDSVSKTVVVNVKSGSCPGLKRFGIDDLSRIDSGLIGKDFSFMIDSSSCMSGVQHKIRSVKAR